MRSENMVIVITGASGGLGSALAMEAGNKKMKVVLMARSREKLERLAGEIKKGGGQALVLTTDITNPESVRTSFMAADNKWGRVDVLFNAAGVVEPLKRIEDVMDSEFINSLSVNLLGMYVATREAFRRMKKQTDGGTVINITSGAAIRPYVGWGMYGSQKAAMDMFTRVASLEYDNKSIRIAAISPGPFESGMQEKVRSTSKEDFPAKDKFVNLHESGKLLKPEIIAPIILEIGLSDWPELSGRIEDIRDEPFQRECTSHNIEIPEELKQ